jgi:predicted dehydrogenase
VRFAVAGADHLHLFQLVAGLLRAGAVPVAHTAEGDLVGGYEGWQGASEPRDLQSILDDADIDLVVTVGVPSERAAVAVAAVEAGKAVLSDKPGVTTRAQLDELRAALARRTGRPWTVLFTERFENRAISRAVQLVGDGAIGRVVHIAGAGPHSLYADGRPEWFWDPARSGGILADIGSQQVDQFVAVAAPDDPSSVRVAASRAGNVACAERPAMQDTGTMTLVAPGVVGEHRVDWLSPPGLGTWGDARLTITGTAGTIEVRANVDVDGRPGGEHLLLVDGEGSRRVDVSGDPLPWPELLVADLADGGERLMSQDHVVAVCDLALRAQEQAEPWGTGADAR